MKDFEDELDKIRIALYEETKNMTNAEMVNFFNKRGKKIANQHGFKIIPHARHYIPKTESTSKAFK